MRKLFIFLMLISFSQLSAQPWYWINPTTGQNQINDICFISADEGFAVGNNGSLLHYINGEWSLMDSPVNTDLFGISFVSPEMGWAVGANGNILRYQNGIWTQVTSPISGRLKDVCCLDENHCWAAGSAILRYNGSEWLIDANLGVSETIGFLDENHGWAGSSTFNLYKYENGVWSDDESFNSGTFYSFNTLEKADEYMMMNGQTIPQEGLLYENDGNGWVQVNSNNCNSGISYTDRQHGFGLQNAGPMFYDLLATVQQYIDGVWQPTYVHEKRYQFFNTVEAINANEAFVSDTLGFIYHGNNGNWGISNGFTVDSILDIDFTRANNGYFACGTDGIWHYEAGNWSNELKVPGFRFNQIEFLEENFGWAAAYKEVEMPSPFNYESKLFRYFNGVWSEIVISEFVDIWSPVSSLEMIATDMGFSFHNSLYSLIGDNWELFELSINDSITQLVYMEPYPIISPEQGNRQEWEAAWMSVKRMEGDTLGVIYYNNYIENNWEITYGTTTGAFNDLCVSDYMNVYAVGDNGLIAHFNGQTWTESEPVTGEDLLSVYVNDENDGWAVGRNGTLLKYNGMAWSVEQSGTWNDLHKVSFYQDFGLIGGENGTLISTKAEMPVGVANPASPAKFSSLNIYPNPTTGKAYLEFENTMLSNSEIIIYDVTGRLVLSNLVSGYTIGKQTYQLQLNNLENGVYLVKIIIENRILQGKFVIGK